MPILQQPPPRLSWEEFYTKYFVWLQGEHVAVIGTTGSGKSFLIRAIAWKRDWFANLCTKKSDSTYLDFLAQGYVRLGQWPPPKSKTGEWHILLWPKYIRLNDVPKLGKPLFKKMLDHVFMDEGWAVGLDDLYYLAMKLGLKEDITAINYQVRSMGVSLVAAMQRPKKVPLESWDQATWVFLAKVRNYDDLLMIRGVVGVDAPTLRYWMGQLREHEWLAINVISGDVFIVKPDFKPRRKS